MRNSMIALFSATAILAVGSVAAADSTSTGTESTKHEDMMKACMARQKADKTTTKTNDQMMKACMDQMHAKPSSTAKKPTNQENKDASAATPN